MQIFSHLVPSSESDSSDYDNDHTPLNSVPNVHQRAGLFTEHEMDEVSRLNTSLQNSLVSNEINVSNVIASTESQVNNDIFDDDKENSIRPGGDDNDDIQKNLNANIEQRTNNMIDRSHSINESIIDAGKMLPEYFKY